MSSINPTGTGTISGPLPAGTNIIGKVGIDQTIPGTTNGVVEANSATIAGDTTSIDGKITVCDTSGLATESGGNLDTIAGDTTSIDGKITACNTGDVNVTSVPQGAPFFDSDGDNTAQAMKAAAGSLYKLHIINSNASAAYVQLFNVAAGSVTVGTTTPNYVAFVPANGSLTEDFVQGMAFSTAITYACTTTATGSGDPTTGLTVSASYV